MENTPKKFKAIPAFKDHTNCQGHANAVFDSTYETKDERDLLGKILDRLIGK